MPPAYSAVGSQIQSHANRLPFRAGTMHTIIFLIGLGLALGSERQVTWRPEGEQDVKYFWDLQETPQVQRLLMDRLVTLLAQSQQRPVSGSNHGEGSAVTWDEGMAAPSKRQIRYHQCYFNPISCFRRRK